jgi:hypothetical protein
VKGKEMKIAMLVLPLTFGDEKEFKVVQWGKTNWLVDGN